MDHGIKIKEQPTAIVPPVRTTAGLAVFVGTAPLHFAADEDAAENVNKPLLCHTYREAVEQLGFSRNFEDYTLCEAIYSHFVLYNVSPVVLINVLDPNIHKTTVKDQTFEVGDGMANLGKNALKNGLVVTGGAVDTDFYLSYDDGEDLIVTIDKDGELKEATEITASFTRIDPAAVDKYDVIGGVDVETGEYEGLELINAVFPKFGLVPGLVVAPKWSEDPAVAAVMISKSENINAHFRCPCICDIPSGDDGAKKYQLVSEWKNKNNYVYPRQFNCWLKPALGDDVFRMSTQLASLIAWVDAQNEDIPYESPSNKNFKMDRLIREDGKEMFLGPEILNYLNGQGVISALNFIGGWKAWGNRTGAYPAVTDPKDCQIPIRRMFDWTGNQFILSLWQHADRPMTRRLVKTIVNSWNYYLNGLAAREYILGGRIEFLEDENPVTDVIDGKMVFHYMFTPPGAAESITALLEYDPSYVSALFS